MNDTRAELIKSIHEMASVEGFESARFTHSRDTLFAMRGETAQSPRERKRKLQQQTLAGISELSDANLVRLHRTIACDFNKQR
jgi:hypothetical protein